MKVLIDVDALTPPLTGVGQYTLNLVRALQSSPEIEDLKFIRSGHVTDELVILSEPDAGKSFLSKLSIKHILRWIVVKTVRFYRSFFRKLPFNPFNNLLRWFYLKYSAVQFLRESRGISDYVYHGPNYTLLPYRGRSVVTIHDLSVLRHPEFHPDDRVKFWTVQINEVTKLASHIITDSEFQRQEIISLLGVDEAKVSCVYLGVDSRFHPCEESGCISVLEKYKLLFKQFNLVVATLEPRKNFRRILCAFNSLPAALKEAFPLVIVGDKGWLSDDIYDVIDALIEKGQAYRLGYVSDDDLYTLYAAAAVFVYPSLYEGFGLPVLEAMASGTAVITSNVTSIPEVAGDACMLIDPTSEEQLSSGWQTLLLDKKLRVKLELSGQERAKNFSWDNCLEQTLAIYKMVADG